MSNKASGKDVSKKKMNSFKGLLYNPVIKRFIVLALLLLFFYLFRSMMDLIIITFILTFLVNRFHSFITKRISNKVPAVSKVMIILIYIGIIAALSIGAYRYAPKLVWQLNELIQQVISFYSRPLEPTGYEIVDYVMSSLRKIDIAAYLDQGFTLIMKTVTDIGKWGVNVVLALILSLFFMLEKEKVTNFTAKFKSSKFNYFYDELAYFGTKFAFSFGKVIEVQFLIALVNCIASTFFLWLMGFPNLIALGLMIFFLGLMPVIGVIISLIPLCAIAFKIGGLLKVVYVLIMIAVLHAFEAYVMNPKFMSNKTHLPIFYTFTVLIVSEHFFGVWGLLLGIPVFMFVLDMLEVSVHGDEQHAKLKAP